MYILIYFLKNTIDTFGTGDSPLDNGIEGVWGIIGRQKIILKRL